MMARMRTLTYFVAAVALAASVSQNAADAQAPAAQAPTPAPAQGQAAPGRGGRGNQAPAAPRKLMLVDRAGRQTLLGEVPANTNGPRVSPDGTRLAYGSGGLWVGPLMNIAAMKRIGDGQFPYWSADGTRLFFTPSAEVLSWRRVDAEDAGEQIWTPVRAPESRSADGKTLSYVVSVENKFSAWTMNLETRVRTEIPGSGPEALGTQISPDGRWIAYQSTATGRYEIYVQPLGRPGPAVHVTAIESFRPQWSADMREMYFDSVEEGVRTLWVIPIRAEPTFAVAGAPQKLPITGFVQAGVGRRMYDLLPDGRWVIMFP
jgi:Tol biopolymer transport system component